MNMHTAWPSGRVIIIHTDGACLGNPGPGGWAATLKFMDNGIEVSRTTISGGEPATTTNIKMEMRAAIEAVRALPEVDGTTPIMLFADNDLVIKGMNVWLPGWIAQGWRTSAKKPVKNQDLWQELIALVAGLNISWHWVKGHSGDFHNEEVNALASAAALHASNQSLSIKEIA